MKKQRQNFTDSGQRQNFTDSGGSFYVSKFGNRNFLVLERHADARRNPEAVETDRGGGIHQCLSASHAGFVS